MNPISVDIKSIITASTSFEFGKDLFIGQEPEEPDNCLTIYDTGGGEQNAKLALDESTIQIRARHHMYMNAYEWLEDMRILLEGRAGQVIAGAKYIGYWAMSAPMFIERDMKHRALWTINFRITRQPVTQADAGFRLRYA